MTLSFRPTRVDLLRTLIWPTVLPGILTAWKVNLGNASRVVVVAELVGATGGVGYELLQQQQIFDMAGAIAWTLVLVIFVLIVQRRHHAHREPALRYRAGGGAHTMSGTTVEIVFERREQAFAAHRWRVADARCHPQSELRGRTRRAGGRSSARPAAASRRRSISLPGCCSRRRAGCRSRDTIPIAQFDWFRGKIGIVFQNDRLMPWRTAIENVRLRAGAQQGGSRRSAWRRLRRGWRVSVCAATSTTIPMRFPAVCASASASPAPSPSKPEILLCDEPFWALDERDRQCAARRIPRHWCARPAPLAIFITHSIKEALRLGERVLVFERPARIAYEATMCAWR